MKRKLLKVTTVTNRSETLNFKDFMKGEKKGVSNSGHPKQDLIVYSLYINPAAFFDPTFLLIGADVFVVAIVEKKLADNGLISIASTINSILRLALPAVSLVPSST